MTEPKKTFELVVYDDCGGITEEQWTKLLAWYEDLCKKPSCDYVLVFDKALK